MFDIVLMNPPYDDGITKGIVKNLHIKFTSKCIELSKKVVCVMPIKVVKNEAAKSELTSAKEFYNKSIISVEEVNSNLFNDTHMPNVGIYYFNNDKKEGQKIKLDYLSNSFEVNSLLEKTSINETEKEILSYIECDKDHMNWNNVDLWMKSSTLSEDIDKLITSMMNKPRFKNRNIKTPVFLLTNSYNGSMNGKYFTSTTNQICKNIKELKEILLNRKSGKCCILSFNSEKEAENCKIALQNPLLRMACYKNQVDQSMKGRVYKYVPNIDWSDNRVKTDEGLLEVCGCPKDKCKEYADYCKKVIEEIDRKK